MYDQTKLYGHDIATKEEFRFLERPLRKSRPVFFHSHDKHNHKILQNIFQY